MDSALELFCGVGGLHYALRQARPDVRVLRAFDLDDAAAATYRHNFPGTPLSTSSIVSLKAAELEALGADCWLCSPPCQPYTRQGLQLAEQDGRANALEHLLGLLEADGSLLPAALLLENVVGFESSRARARLHALLIGAGY